MPLRSYDYGSSADMKPKFQVSEFRDYSHLNDLSTIFSGRLSTWLIPKLPGHYSYYCHSAAKILGAEAGIYCEEQRSRKGEGLLVQYTLGGTDVIYRENLPYYWIVVGDIKAFIDYKNDEARKASQLEASEEDAVATPSSVTSTTLKDLKKSLSEIADPTKEVISKEPPEELKEEVKDPDVQDIISYYYCMNGRI